MGLGLVNVLLPHGWFEKCKKCNYCKEQGYKLSFTPTVYALLIIRSTHRLARRHAVVVARVAAVVDGRGEEDGHLELQRDDELQVR